MLVFRYTPSSLLTLDGKPVTKAAIVVHAESCQADGLTNFSIKLVFSPEVQKELSEKNITVWAVTNKVADALGLSVRYDLERAPKPPAPVSAPKERKPRASRKAVA